MRTHRQTRIRRAILTALSAVPAGYLLPDDLLRIEAARYLQPRPTTAELDAEIGAADTERLVVGIPGEEVIKWKLSDAGRAWLAENA